MNDRHDENTPVELERELERSRDLLEHVRRSARSAAHDWSSDQESSFVQRVLAQTTREDLGWRGDLHLLRDYVGARLKSSRALRVLAASLVVHLLVGPAVALWVYRTETKPEGIQVSLLPSFDDRFDGESEEIVPEEPALDLGDPLDTELDAGEVENVLRRDRFLVGSRGSRELSQQARTSRLEDLLALRASALRRSGGAVDFDLADPAEFSPLERVVLIETMLDQVALKDVRPSGLSDLLSLTSRRATRGAADGDALIELERRAVDRARAYRAWPAPPGFEPLSSAPPLDEQWFELLGAAAPELARPDGLLERWASHASR